MRWWVPAVLALAAFTAGCTVTDDFVRDVGTTRLVFVDPDLASQDAGQTFVRAQAVKWAITQACLDIDGDLVDLGNLTTGCAAVVGTCEYADSIKTNPYSGDPCAVGLVVGASPDEPQIIQLAASFTMTVWIAEPPEELLAKEEWDSDGYPNEVDNCPWVSNDQRDENLDGIGDRCQVLSSTGATVLDSDGDEVPDSADNCVWVYNPGQENTTDETGKGVDDGIGDGCAARLVNVVDDSGGTRTISIAKGPVNLYQARNSPSYITIDFTDALDCGDWSGDCVLTLGKIRLCAARSVGTGCS